MPTLEEITARTDLVLFRAEATGGDVDSFCSFARQHQVRSVCAAGAWVERVAARLEDTPIKTVALVGFPLGTSDGDVKRFEVEAAIDHGAQEIEFVLNAGRIREEDSRSLLREMRDVTEAAEERPVCAVLQTGLLTVEQVRQACLLALDSGIHSVATGTGFPGVVHPDITHIGWLREAVGEQLGVKSVLYVASPDSAAACLEAGADRVGVSDFELWEARPLE